MSVQFSDTASQGISFPGAEVDNLAQLTISVRITPSSISGAHAGHILSKYDPAASIGFDLLVYPTNPCIWFSYGWSGSANYAIWRSPASGISAGTEYHIMVSYDRGATANNPVIYINGSSVTVTELNAPVGAVGDDSGQNLFIGARTSDYPIIGLISDVRIYDRILSVAEVDLIYDEDITVNRTINESGLVFHAPLTCAQGLTYPTFPGATLSGTNYLIDRCACDVGTPVNSPLGA